MTQRKLKNRIALLIVGGHILSFLSLFVATVKHMFDPKLTIVTAGIIGPFFAFYLVTILKDLARDWEKPTSEVERDGLFPTIALTFVTLFSASVPLLIILKATSRISDPDDFKLYLSLVETAYATSVAFVMDHLFAQDRNRRGPHQQREVGANVSPLAPGAQPSGRKNKK